MSVISASLIFLQVLKTFMGRKFTIVNIRVSSLVLIPNVENIFVWTCVGRGSIFFAKN